MTNARDKANIPVLNFQSKGIDDNATSTSITIDSNENVGIGGVPPTVNQRLFIEGSNAALIMAEIKNIGGAVGLQLTADNGDDARVVFGDLADNGRGRIVYSNSDESMFFAVNNLSEKMRITSAGLVGIGTSSPTHNLTIDGGTSSNIALIKDATGAATVRYYDGGSQKAYIQLTSAENMDFFAAGGVDQIFYGNGVERMRLSSGATFNEGSNDADFRVESNGNANMLFVDGGNDRVGVGTSSPSLKLEVNGDIKSDGITNRTSLQGVDATPTDNNTYELANGYLNLYRDDTAEVNQIQFGKNGTLAAAFSTGADYLAIKTNGDNERMRILSNGRICINRTSSVGAAKLDISHPGSSEYGLTLDSSNTSGTQYHLDIRRGGSQAGYIASTNATTVTLASASDERLKENIENSGSALQDIKDLKVRQFDWKDNIDTHRDFGFVAQELVNVIPEAVSVGSDELDDNGKPKQSWGVDYSHIVPRLVKAVQEQQTKIETLEAEVTALKNQP